MSYEHTPEQFMPAETYKDMVGPDVLHVISRVRYHDASQNLPKPQKLIAIGSWHISDPGHWYYGPAMEIFHNWEEATRGTPRMFIAEGNQDLWGLGETAGHAISEHYSSVGLQCLLAEMHDISIISGEPRDYCEISQLMLEFPPKEVLLHYGIIHLPLLYRMRGAKPSLDEYMEGQIFPSFQRQLGRVALTLEDSHPLHDFDFSYQNFRDSYREYFGHDPTADDSELNDFYLRITSAQLEHPDFARQPVARVAPRRRDLRYSSLAAVQAELWESKISSLTWRGIFHTMALDEYFKQFGHAERPPLRSWKAARRTRSGYLLDRPSESSQTDYEWKPWEFRQVERSERPLPPHLLDPDSIPSEAAKTRIKIYFSKRALEPIGPNTYITHLTQPFTEWKAGFSSVCKELETQAELLHPGFMVAYGRLKGATHMWHWRERFDALFDNPRVAPLFVDRDSHISDALQAACLRLNLQFCHKQSEYASFNRRVLQLLERFILSSQSIQQAIVAFDAASKHLTALPTFHLYDINLTPVETLQYCLETLEHELQKSSDY